MRTNPLGRGDLNPSQLPEWLDFEAQADDDTLVSPKEGFILKLAEIRLGDWRLREDSGTLWLEHWDGSAWDTVTEFTAP